MTLKRLNLSLLRRVNETMGQTKNPIRTTWKLKQGTQIMTPNKLMIAVTAAIFSILASTVAAMAVPATATGAVNVRTGPSTSYAIVDQLYAGENVEVTQCQSGWCYVQHSGPDGWVSGNYLSIANQPQPQPQPQPNDPDCNFGLQVGPGGPNFSINCGNGNPTPPPAPVTPKVCFHSGNNYSGNSFCVNAGSGNSNLGGYWNDRISSVQVQSGASVQVCRNSGFGGFCQTYSSSVPVLNGFLNNQISSYQTYN